MFLWTPVVDVRLRRRTWLLLAALSAAALVFIACPLIGASNFNLLAVLLLPRGALLALVYASCGGLMTTTLSATGQGKAAAWNRAGNFGGGVLGAALVLWLAQRVSTRDRNCHSSPDAAARATCLNHFQTAARLVLLVSRPVWGMGREARAVLRSPRRRWSVLLMISPACTCAAQPLLPALASRYGVDAQGVLWNNGVAGGILLAAGSLLGLLVPGDWDRRLTYVGAGLTNAVGAMVLLAPQAPILLFCGEFDTYLLTAGFCQARAVALTLDVVGNDIGDASTWFSALTALSGMAVVSMIWLEGRMYHYFGAHGLLWTDAAGNLLVFAIVVTALLVHSPSHRLSQ